MRIVKSYEPHYVKALGDQGIVQPVVSVFNNIDTQGDRVRKGAFLKSLARWKASGERIPVIFSHLWQDIMAHVGYVVDAKETDEGLEVAYKLDLDTERGAHLFRLMKERRLVEHSFAYDVVREEAAEDGANELLELDLLEVGPTLKGANPETRLISVKNTTVSNGTVVLTNTPTSKAAKMIADARAKTDDPDLIRSLDRLASMEWPDRNLWLLEAHLEDVVGDSVIKSLNDQLDAIEHGQRRRDADAMVDAFLTAVRLEMVEEKLAEARASSLDAELNERAAHTVPVPEFDERFAVKSVPTQYESGDTEQVQVVGLESETFRVAIHPGTMRPDHG